MPYVLESNGRFHVKGKRNTLCIPKGVSARVIGDCDVQIGSFVGDSSDKKISNLDKVKRIEVYIDQEHWYVLTPSPRKKSRLRCTTYKTYQLHGRVII